MKIYVVRTDSASRDDNWPDCVTTDRTLAIQKLAEVSENGESLYDHWIQVYNGETGSELKRDPDNLQLYEYFT